MTDSQDPKVLEFRMQRLRKAPRNWAYWVAAFTAANGIFLALQHELQKILLIPLAAYLIDTFFTGYAALWSGLIMHLVVLAFVGSSFLGIRALKTLQAQNSGA